jgi:hypothetical protein
MRTEILDLSRTALMALLLLAANGWAQVPGEKTSGGIVFRIGIASAEQVSSLPPEHADGQMHPSQSRPGRTASASKSCDRASGRRSRPRSTTGIDSLPKENSHDKP